MAQFVACTCLAALLTASAYGQTALAQPTFDAADVHVSARSTNPSMRAFITGGRYELHTATMLDLVRTAFGVDETNVVGGPAWLETDRFDVIAKAPANTTPDALKLMLRALLADRFKLVVHNDSKPLSAYILTLVKKNSQLKEAAGQGNTGCQGQPEDGPAKQSFSCHNMTMAAFAETIRGLASGYIGGLPVIDQTGLKGAWDFNIKWTGRAQLVNAGSDGISLFDAIDKQLGLKLELQKTATPVIVVDSVNQKPTDNLPGVSRTLPAMPTEFEVADIKPSAPNTPEDFRIQPGGRIDAKGVTMRDLIKAAWNIDDGNDDMLSGPKWLDAERFDIVAKASSAIAAGGQQMDEDALTTMLRNMLIARFRIAIHKEDRPVSVYALVASKPKLKKADPANRASCKNNAALLANAAASALSRSFTCQNTTMQQFVDRLDFIAQAYMDHPVIDATGLDGAWDFTLSFTPRRLLQAGGGRGGDGAPGASDPNGALTVFEALERQLGLKLELQKRPMPVLVIDHIEQKPTDN